MTDRRAALIDQYRPTDEMLRSRMDLYGLHLVRIKGKDGALHPFVMNPAQAMLHEKIERQRETTGRVRAVVLKARQLGISTYVAVRFYRGTTLWPGRRTFILTHEDAATENLFDMVKRIHDHMPDEFKPTATGNAAKALDFGGLDSGYRVGTAGNRRGVGRSATIHQFHGSESSFWPVADEHVASAFQAIPTFGSEMILESTANGPGGVFYDIWQLAEAGRSDFLPVFLPWFIDAGYRRDPEPGWEPAADIADYATLHSLDAHQARWMVGKIQEMGSDGSAIPWRFRQEYPSSAIEAFQTAGVDSLIPGELVMRARKWTAPDQSHAARVLGCDIARGGGDYTRLMDRQGRKAGRIDITIDVADLTVVADRIAHTLNENTDILMAFVDMTGIGAGVVDILRRNGFSERVTGVNFGSAAIEPERYPNRRCEMWGRMAEWFKDEGGCDIPDSDALHRQLTGPSYKFDANSRLIVERKEDQKKRLGFSPDGGDALALTHATHIAKPEIRKPSWRDEVIDGGDDWKTAW